MAYTYTVTNKRIVGRNRVVTLVVKLDNTIIGGHENFGASDLDDTRIQQEASTISAFHAQALSGIDAITEVADTPVVLNPPPKKEVVYAAAVRELERLTALVNLKVIADTDKEYTDAIQAVKDAKTALETK